MKFDYDLVVIGGGAAGLTAAGMGANFGAKTMLVESQKLGGDCTWFGCVPSKTLLHASKMARMIKDAEQFGHRSAKEIDFASIMKHVRDTRQGVYEEADEPGIYRGMGIEVVFGRSTFTDSHKVRIENTDVSREVSARYFIIATGSKPAVPAIQGLGSVPYYTNETIFELTSQPKSMAIIGGGPIGVEMAQAFQNLGTDITIYGRQNRILPKDDEELSDMLLNRLGNEGVRFELGISIDKVVYNGAIQVSAEQKSQNKVFKSDALLVATGRNANFKDLNLEEAGVNYSASGITVDDRCRTNVRHIYAVGDVTGRYQFTHMSEHMDKVAATNALLKIPMKIDQKHVPWSTYTEPELAHVGATEKQLIEKDTSYEVYRFPYSKVDRAITEGAKDGLIKVFAKKMNGKILGAAIYGKQAGDLISEYAIAMRYGVTLRNIADTIHPYPTYALGVRRAADQWYVKNQSEWLTRLIKGIFGYRGTIPDLSDKNRIV